MSKSKFQATVAKRLFKKYRKYGIVEDTRPDWLVSSRGERLELDFFIDKLSVAVEVQGEQHFEFAPAFHETEQDFREQLRRDEEKKAICNERGIDLLYICKPSDTDAVVYQIDQKIESRRLSMSDEWIGSNKNKFTPRLISARDEMILDARDRRIRKAMSKVDCAIKNIELHLTKVDGRNGNRLITRCLHYLGEIKRHATMELLSDGQKCVIQRALEVTDGKYRQQTSGDILDW